jgi:uncharacterized Rmd1/YagE family protein
MLQLLKENVSSRHAERLEQIVIVLIAIEIGAFTNYEAVDCFNVMKWPVLGIVTILVDLFA